MKVTYYANNPGGHWRLTDADWVALESAGWTVSWLTEDQQRWMGAKATIAHKQFETLKDGILEWEKITGQDSTEDGLPTGNLDAPHAFGVHKNAMDIFRGRDLIPILFGEDAPRTLREALERLQE